MPPAQRKRIAERHLIVFGEAAGPGLILDGAQDFLDFAQEAHVDLVGNAFHVLFYFGARRAFDQGRRDVAMADGELRRPIRNAHLFLFAMGNRLRIDGRRRQITIPRDQSRWSPS